MVKQNKGFTLIELLIIIGIIGFLAAAILVAVDPVRRIQEARDSRRWSEVNGLLNAYLNKQADDKEYYYGYFTGGGTEPKVYSAQVLGGGVCTEFGTQGTCEAAFTCEWTPDVMCTWTPEVPESVAGTCTGGGDCAGVTPKADCLLLETGGICSGPAGCELNNGDQGACEADLLGCSWAASVACGWTPDTPAVPAFCAGGGACAGKTPEGTCTATVRTPAACSGVGASEAYAQVIVSDVAGVNCTAPATSPVCDPITLDDGDTLSCVADLRDLAPEYISALPIDPHGTGWDADPGNPNLVLDDNNTGYYVDRTASGRITIGACHPERPGVTISVQR